MLVDAISGAASVGWASAVSARQARAANAAAAR